MGQRSGVPDLLAVHKNGTDARRTIERLSRAGVDGGAIRLLGRVEAVSAGRHGDRQTDLGSSLALGGRVARGLLYGVPPGAIFGAVLLAVTAEPSVYVVAAGLAGGAGFGGAVGILTSLLSTPTMAPSWERTFAPMVPGGVGVGIRVESARDQRRIRRVLARPGVLRVHEIGDLDAMEDGPLAFDD
ncbi:MAG TPA: hypothetical protein VK906_17175 [Egicoccus sp.]|nr:hypothetical protein [Egicoccus sp.]HSK24920.1 hypothetical protein [Egicoccus sp.]